MTRHPHALIVAGPPGAGKTTLARHLIRRRPTLALVDKDTLVSPLLVAAQQLAGDQPHDTDSPLYQQTLRSRCYQTVYDVAAEAAALGQTPTIVAPYAAASDNAQLADDIADQIGVGHCHLVWVHTTTPQELHRRMQTRNADRDHQALTDWPTWSQHITTQLPAGPHLAVNSSSYQLDELDQPTNAILDMLDSCRQTN